MPKIKRSSCKAEIKEIFGSCSSKKNIILNMHETREKNEEVFGVMSYNYMLLALYSLKSFFRLLGTLSVRLILGLYLFFVSAQGTVCVLTWCCICCCDFMNSNRFSKRHTHVEFFGFWHVEFFPLCCSANGVYVCVYVFNFFLCSNIFDSQFRSLRSIAHNNHQNWHCININLAFFHSAFNLTG